MNGPLGSEGVVTDDPGDLWGHRLGMISAGVSIGLAGLFVVSWINAYDIGSSFGGAEPEFTDRLQLAARFFANPASAVLLLLGVALAFLPTVLWAARTHRPGSDVAGAALLTHAGLGALMFVMALAYAVLDPNEVFGGGTRATSVVYGLTVALLAAIGTAWALMARQDVVVRPPSPEPPPAD